MAVPVYDLDVKRGDSIPIAITVTRNNAAVNLTSATIYGTIKSAIVDADPGQGQVTNGSGVTITDAVNGIALVEWPASTFAAITSPGTYRYDIQVTESGGRKSTVLEGHMTVSLDITRA